MEYSAIAAAIKTKITNLENSLTSIKNISFDSVWSGSNCDKLTSDLEEVINKINTEKTNLDNFVTALNKLQKYKDNHKKILSLESEILALPAESKQTITEKNMVTLNTYGLTLARKKALINENEVLKKEIKQLLSFNSISTKLSLISFSFVNDLDYMFDVDEIKLKYMNNWYDDIDGTPLRIISPGESLYDYYDQVDENGVVIEGSGEKYINGIMEQIQSTYSGREATVNCTLALLKLAADKGVKVRYTNYHDGTSSSKPYTATAVAVSGIDCNAFASWSVNMGSSEGFHWLSCGGFSKAGNEIKYENYSTAQPGDVFVFSRGDGTGHVGVIIENNSETGEFIVAEATGPGVIMKTRSYESLKNQGYQVRDMSSYYNEEPSMTV